jgi:hypothetical protein
MSSTDAILRGRCDACGLDIQQYCKQLLVCSISNQLYHDCKWFRTETKLGSNLRVLSFVLGSMKFWLIRGLEPPPPTHTPARAHVWYLGPCMVLNMRNLDRGRVHISMLTTLHV